MIHDDLNIFNDAQRVTATGFSTDVLDLSADRNLGIGEPMSVIVVTDVDADDTDGTEVYTVELESASDEAFTTPISIVKREFTNAQALVDLVAGGDPVVLAIPQDERCDRFLRVKHTLAGSVPDWTYTAILQPTHGVPAEVRGGYPNNRTIS